jgi:hypothetical protein
MRTTQPREPRDAGADLQLRRCPSMLVGPRPSDPNPDGALPWLQRRDLRYQIDFARGPHPEGVAWVEGDANLTKPFESGEPRH